MLDDDALIYAVAREDGSCPDDVVGIDGQDRLLSLHVLYGALWYQHGLRTRADTDADAHELARQHRVIGITECRLHFQRAGLRVDAVQRVLDAAAERRRAAVARHELDRERRAGVLEQRQFRLAHLKTHPDGIERHDRRQRLR